MSFKALTQAERITALEVQIDTLNLRIKSMDEKIDELLALRNKGAGAFWLASTLFGASLIGVLSLMTSWWKG